MSNLTFLLQETTYSLVTNKDYTYLTDVILTNKNYSIYTNRDVKHYVEVVHLIPAYCTVEQGAFYIKNIAGIRRKFIDSDKLIVEYKP